MEPILDHVKDRTGKMLYQINKTWLIPDFVKEAKQLEPEETAKLPLAVFAFAEQRLYPVHTREDAWLSRAAFTKNASLHTQAESQHIAEILKHAEKFWQLDPMQLQQKTACGNVYEYRAQGKVHAKITAQTPEDIQKIAADAIAPHGKYPWEMRRDLCRQLLDTAEKMFKTEMLDQIQKTAGMGCCSVEDANHAIELREVSLGTYTEFKKPLQQLRQLVEKEAKAEVVPPIVLDKVAAVLDLIDNQLGLATRYSGVFQPPEKDLFRITPSRFYAFQKAAVCLPNGTWVMCDKLNSAETKKFVRETLGIQFEGDMLEKEAGKFTPVALQQLTTFLAQA
jgi:hypothetical protein